MIVKVVIPDSIYARVYFARGEQGPQGPTGPTGLQGPSGVVNVDSPITNSGTSTAANIGINQALLSITPAQVVGTAVITTDPRLSDTRIPTDASVTDSKIIGTGLSPNKITGTAVITTDSRLSDARTPLAHAASHGSAGSDPVTLAQSQITNLVSDLSAKAPIDSPVFTTKVTLPVTSGTFLGTNSLGEIYKVGASPGLGYLPYTASVGGGIAWQNLATLVKTDSANTFTVGGHLINTGATTTKGLIIKRVASQTANLLEFQLQDGTIMSRVDSSGDAYFGLVNSSYQVLISSGGAAILPLRVRGAASQSANLQEWQNSAGTAVLAVTSSGFISSNSGANFNSALTQIGAANGGGQITFNKQTAATTNPGANALRIYVRDGTNAGTLKLVVRAGAAGAETTILDNIPQ